MKHHLLLILCLIFVLPSMVHGNVFPQEKNLITENIPKFPKDGIQEIALITMVKNEEDIIFENLAWHYAIGFRKFIILDNNSTDNTLRLIENFKQMTQGTATVYIIKDPIVAHIQNRKMSAAYQFVSNIWHDEVKWIFPVDADEFWVPKKDLPSYLKSLPKETPQFFVASYKYHHTADYYKKSKGKMPFYKKISHRDKLVRSSKVFVRANIQGLSIGPGNHCAYSGQSKFPCPLLNKLGKFHPYSHENDLYMVEFYMRSPKQAHQKLYLGGISNKKAIDSKKLYGACGKHKTSYLKFHERHGEAAGKMKFDEELVESGAKNIWHDPLPMDQALAFLEKNAS